MPASRRRARTRGFCDLGFCRIDKPYGPVQPSSRNEGEIGPQGPGVRERAGRTPPSPSSTSSLSLLRSLLGTAWLRRASHCEGDVAGTGAPVPAGRGGFGDGRLTRIAVTTSTRVAVATSVVAERRMRWADSSLPSRGRCRRSDGRAVPPGQTSRRNKLVSPRADSPFGCHSYHYQQRVQQPHSPSLPPTGEPLG
jgi:hypothetical protein